jgi:MFS transporter, FHS family, glucose/mannose:H+ symporter
LRALIRANAGLLFAGIATFVVMGAGQSLYGPSLPVYSRAFGIPLGSVGYLVSAHWVGCFVGVGVMFLRGGSVTPRHVLAIMALGSFGLAVMQSWSITLVAAVIFGTGYGMATAVFNPRVLTAFGDRGSSMLSLLNATYAVGAIASPLVFVVLHSDPRWSFGLTSALCAMIWVFAKPAGAVQIAASAADRPFRPHLGILGFGAISVGTEASLVGLGPSALIAAGLAEDRAATLLSAFFVVFLLARMVLIFAAHLIPPYLMLIGALMAAGLFALGAALGPPGIFFVAMGAPAGMFFPGFYVSATNRMGSDLRVPPTIIAAGLIGGIFAPLIVAPMMADLGPRGFFWMIAALTLGTAALGAVSWRWMAR